MHLLNQVAAQNGGIQGAVAPICGGGAYLPKKIARDEQDGENRGQNALEATAISREATAEEGKQWKCVL